MTVSFGTTTKALLAGVASIMLQACAPKVTEYAAVADAYNASGVLPAQPYTRTIFSSHNF